MPEISHMLDAPQRPVIRSRAIPIDSDVDVFAARLAGAELCAEAHFGVIDRQCVVTSISELAQNIVSHARGGAIAIRLLDRDDGAIGVEVLAEDQGPGIPDIEAALRDGFSTHGTMGCGLPAVKRLMSEIDISSVQGKGTVVRAVKWSQGK